MNENKEYSTVDASWEINLPEWLRSKSTEEQIQYQLEFARINNPDWKHFTALTFDKNREPKIQRTVVEVKH